MIALHDLGNALFRLTEQHVMVSNGPYRGPHRYPGHEMSSIDDYLACAYDRSRVACSCAAQGQP